MVIVEIDALVFILQLSSLRGYTDMKLPFLWTISRDILFFQDLYVSSWLYSESRDALDTQTGFLCSLPTSTSQYLMILILVPSGQRRGCTFIRTINAVQCRQTKITSTKVLEIRSKINSKQISVLFGRTFVV